MMVGWAMDKANIFGNLAKDLTREQFEPIVNTDGVLVERITSKAHVTPAGQIDTIKLIIQ
ncbi:hypothetical protein swp_4280 [Shewanella piezotolerans WP3]|uniref:Uncharacterized protein n=2 Tax=Shewanella TaxID=22 RepID=B8CU75_SHEPW|nr:hypothetical protein swp_4280 [Shewanella piezotolerans WP3]